MDNLPIPGSPFGTSTPGTINVRYYDPKQGGVVEQDITDYGHYPLYSTVTVAQNQQSELTFFANPIGSTKPGSTGMNTKLDTNMRTASQLDAAGRMLVFSLRLVVCFSQGATSTPVVSNISVVDMLLLQARAYVAFYVATEKPLQEGDLTLFPAGGGPFTSAAGAAAATNAVVINGFPSQKSARQLVTPIYIPPVTNFRGSVEFLPGLSDTTLSATRDLRMIADGLRQRAAA